MSLAETETQKLRFTDPLLAVVQPGICQNKGPRDLPISTLSSEFRSGLFLTTSCLYPVSPSRHFLLSHLHAHKDNSPRSPPQTWLLSYHFFAFETTILLDILPWSKDPAPTATSKLSLTLFRTHCSLWVVIPMSKFPLSCNSQLRPCLLHRGCLNYSRPRSMAPGGFVITLSWGGGSSGPVAPVVFSLCSLQLRLPVAPFIVQSHLPQGVICSLGIKTRLYNFSGSAPWVGCTVQMLGKYLLIDESQ